MTGNAAREEPLILTASADPLDDLFDRERPRDSNKPPERSASRPPKRRKSNAWLIATLASVIWILTVLAFCWSRYSLPGTVSAAADAAKTRIEIFDWLMIAAALLGPLLLIWLVATLIRRSAEMRDESRELTHAAMRLSQAAKEVESRGLVGLPGGSIEGDIAGETPRHLRREVERATHAISALHSQMRAIEEALSTQAAAIDDVAERAEQRARTISKVLSSEREALELAAERSGALDRREGSGTGAALAGATAAALGGAALSANAGASGDISARGGDDVDVVDLSLDTQNPRGSEHEGIASLRAELADAKANATWQTPRLSDSDAPADLDMGSFQGSSMGGSFEAAEAAAPDSARIDPFDDIGAKGAAAVAATGVAGLGAASALSARDDEDSPALKTVTDEADSDASAYVADSDNDDEPLSLQRRHSVDWVKFVRASNFPESEDDTETLDALYDVLTDPDAASLLQSAEDTLASLADIDLYMEDFVPEMMPVSSWKSHLDGNGSGEAIEAIKAPIEQSRIRAKLSADKGFETLANKFMGRFEEMLRRMMRESDNERLVVELADTRTGRAYLMLADSSGRIGRKS